MHVFVARRLATLVIQVFLVATIIFLMMRLVPGDPARAILGETASDDQVATMQDKLGLNEPMLEQYTSWLGNAAQGDLGKSIISGRSVSGDIEARIWSCLLYTSDAADDLTRVDLGGRRIIKKKKKKK